MADQDSDGIQEAFEGTQRVTLTAAAMLGEHLARHFEQDARKLIRNLNF